MSNSAFPRRRSFFMKNRDMATLGFVLIVVFILISLFIPDRFLRVDNFQSMAFQLPELGLLAMAMMVTILTGGINLSIISSANLSGIVTALILTRLIPPGTTGGYAPVILLAILAGILTSLVLGLLNGFLIAFLEVSPILATLGTMVLFEGLAIIITRGYVISGFPREFLFIGNGVVLGIPFPLIIFLICAVILSVLLNRTPLGIGIYMLGSNPIATLFSGINVRSILLRNYLISGFLAGIAALIMISRFNSAKADYASSYLLVTVLVSVLGGINPAGGFGKITGLVLALVILQMISSGFNLLRVSSYLTIAMWGTILIVVMGFNRFTAKYRGG